VVCAMLGCLVGLGVGVNEFDGRVFGRSLCFSAGGTVVW
jgi:hypothetical protein